MAQGQVLVVENDLDIVKVVRTYLERAGYAVEAVTSGRAGLERALEVPFDVIILDWGLPGLSGLEFIQQLRTERATPIIMLTARTEEGDRILGLERGADDYVTKPFSPRELVARVQAMLRRAALNLESQELVQRGSLLIDPLARRVEVAGRTLELTVLEFDLLYTLAREPGRVYNRDELLERVWGREYLGVDRVVDVHISNLRQKLESASLRSLIVTLRGIGYKFTETFE